MDPAYSPSRHITGIHIRSMTEPSPPDAAYVIRTDTATITHTAICTPSQEAARALKNCTDSSAGTRPQRNLRGPLSSAGVKGAGHGDIQASR